MRARKRGRAKEGKEGSSGTERGALLEADWLRRPALSTRFIRVRAAWGSLPSLLRPREFTVWTSVNRSGRGPPGRESARRREAEEGRERSRSRAPELRAPSHAPGQPRLRQVPARLGGDGQLPWCPTRGSAASRAFSTGSGAAPRRLPLHVPGAPGAGTGPGGLQHRSVPVLSSAGEWLTSMPDSLPGKLSLALGLGSPNPSGSRLFWRERDPLRKGTWGPPATLICAFSAQCSVRKLSSSGSG